MKESASENFQVDCVAMKRKIQRAISTEVRGMSREERLAHYVQLSGASRKQHRTVSGEKSRSANRSGE